MSDLKQLSNTKKGTPTSTGITDSMLQKARQLYSNMLNSFQEGVRAANTLFDKDDEESAILRGLLLCREPGVGATYDELWLGRLQYEIKLSSLSYDLTSGEIVKSNIGVLTAANIVDNLAVSLDVILSQFRPDEREKFCKGKNTINLAVVRALHNIGKNVQNIGNKVLFKGLEGMECRLERNSWGRGRCFILG